ncbi:MAG: adenylate/guanylate cyclase domain-containing protein [Chthoniobacter sp.]|uniref:adenylate/guanylate cyclase domain-containing protein n=1 Tax=Chthoniobacter sp. TaxID=2510640 RepID=UPI0032A73282
MLPDELISARILLVDDQQPNLDLLEVFLGDAGYTDLHSTRDPRRVCELLDTLQPDLVVLDLHMPQMDGFEVMAALRPRIPATSYLPIIVLTADATREARERALSAGANDFLTKPLDETETLLRIRNLLATRALHLALQDRHACLERANQELAAERETSERLLLNVLPRSIADRLRQTPGTIADSFEEATILFADIVGFTGICAGLAPEPLVAWLNEVFCAIDVLAEEFGLEKIKTIGDAYMVVGGLPHHRPDHAEAVANLALALHEVMTVHRTPTGEVLQLRIGIHMGRVVAGVIGKRKFAYDLWGDTVNTASRMQTHGIGGATHVSAAVRERLSASHTFDERGEIPIKGKGLLTTFLLTGRLA